MKNETQVLSSSRVRPEVWKEAIILRNSSRIFPLALAAIGELDSAEHHGDRLLLALFQSHFFSFCSVFLQGKTAAISVRNAAIQCEIPSSHASRDYYSSVMAIRAVQQAVSHHCSWDDANVAILYAVEKFADISSALADEMRKDTALADSADDQESRVRILSKSPLWSANRPPWFLDTWQRVNTHLARRNQNFEIWSRWYEQ
jgi:hypothetical protein